MLSQEEGCHRMGGRDCGGGGLPAQDGHPAEKNQEAQGPAASRSGGGPGGQDGRWTGREEGQSFPWRECPLDTPEGPLLSLGSLPGGGQASPDPGPPQAEAALTCLPAELVLRP